MITKYTIPQTTKCFQQKSFCDFFCKLTCVYTLNSSSAFTLRQHFRISHKKQRLSKHCLLVQRHLIFVYPAPDFTATNCDSNIFNSGCLISLILSPKRRETEKVISSPVSLFRQCSFSINFSCKCVTPRSRSTFCFAFWYSIISFFAA